MYFSVKKRRIKSVRRGCSDCDWLGIPDGVTHGPHIDELACNPDRIY